MLSINFFLILHRHIISINTIPSGNRLTYVNYNNYFFNLQLFLIYYKFLQEKCKIFANGVFSVVFFCACIV